MDDEIKEANKDDESNQTPENKIRQRKPADSSLSKHWKEKPDNQPKKTVIVYYK